MSVFQIWGSFSKEDPEHPTTTSTFRKGQLMPDGVTTLEQFDRKFAEEDGEDFVLLYEFDVVTHLANREIHEHLPSPAMEQAIAGLVSEAFMEGWWGRKDDDDNSQDEPEPDGALGHVQV